MVGKSLIFAISLAAGLASGLSTPQAQQAVRVSEITRTQLFAPLYVAMAKDFFGQEGLKIDLSSANGGDRVGALILSGGADIGLTGPEVPIYIFNSEFARQAGDLLGHDRHRRVLPRVAQADR